VQLTHSFRIPVAVDEAWAVLRDIGRVAPCMPGATVDEVDGDHFTGGIKVKVGPITVTYRGEVDFVHVDEEHHRASIEARGRETRGTGTARGTVHAELREDGAETEVTLVTDLSVTGKPAQFGRGVMAEVGAKLVRQFAECLSSELAAQPAADRTAAGVPSRSSAVGVDPAAEAGITGGTAPAPATSTLGPDGTDTAPPAVRVGPSEPAASTPAPEPAAAGTHAPGAPSGNGAARTRPSDEAIDLLGVAGTPILSRLAPIAGALAALFLLVSLLRRRTRRRRPTIARAGTPLRYGTPTLAVVTLHPVEDD